MIQRSKRRTLSSRRDGDYHQSDLCPLLTKEMKDGFMVRVGGLGGSEGPFEGAFGLISGIYIPSRIGTCEKKVAQSVDIWERKDPDGTETELSFPLFPAACSQYGLHMVLYRNLRVQSCTVLLQRE